MGEAVRGRAVLCDVQSSMIALGTYTTKVRTQDGVIHDLGAGDHPPRHNECITACPSCLVVNAWTERVAK